MTTHLMRPRNAGFLGHAAVIPEDRGLGAGRALGEAVIAWSRDEGYDWTATDWRSANLEANRTWLSLGFIPSFFRLHRFDRLTQAGYQSMRAGTPAASAPATVSRIWPSSVVTSSRIWAAASRPPER